VFGSRSASEQFEATVMRHMDAAYNLALWLARNDADAQDVVQEASLRAFRFFDRFDGRDARAWFLTIVRNSFYSWLRKNRPDELAEPLDPETCDVASDAPPPDVEVLRNITRDQLWKAMGELQVEIRETLVLREFEELSYREISDLTGAPIGTVMSRLSRGRRQLQKILGKQDRKGVAK
jgi:RNA polymerase sigma-70 factor (ECF subfamily)